MTTADSSILLRITPGYWEGDELQLRFPPERQEEVLALLDEEGVEHNTGLEFSFGPAEWIENVTVLGGSAGAALTGLSLVLHRFFTRNDGKSVELDVDGEVKKVTGFSPTQFRALLDETAVRKSEQGMRMREQFDAENPMPGRTDPEARSSSRCDEAGVAPVRVTGSRPATATSTEARAQKTSVSHSPQDGTGAYSSSTGMLSRSARMRERGLNSWMVIQPVPSSLLCD